MNEPAASSHSPEAPTNIDRAPLEPLPPEMTSIQPGGGVCLRIELAWGAWRRWWLKTFRRGYVRRMAETRRGDENRCPHEVLDPRDVKFFRNQGGYRWDPADDPFAWRDCLPFARVGLAELLLMTGACAVAAAGLAFVWPPLAAGPGLLALFFAWFFRNPRRRVPAEPGLVVSPADGKVVTVERLPHDDFVGGPVVVIGIFLSVFNVHINRVPVRSRVIGLHYRRGKFLNALRAASVRENEQLAVRIEEADAPHRRMVVKQIAGAIARRIVCWVAPGETLERGDQFGMIKLGSRTELVLPDEPQLSVEVRPGDHVQAGTSVLARYNSSSAPPRVPASDAGR